MLSWLPILYQIIINSTTPCWENVTSPISVWQNCGAGRDYLQFATLGFDWVTGGFFSALVVALIILMVYIKYHKAIYPIIIGIIYSPIAIILFPENFKVFAEIMLVCSVFVFIIYIVLRQTKEYSG